MKAPVLLPFNQSMLQEIRQRRFQTTAIPAALPLPCALQLKNAKTALKEFNNLIGRHARGAAAGHQDTEN